MLLTDPNAPRLCLPTVSDITVCAELKQNLLEALARGNGLAVDASDVQRIASPCVQVLVSGVISFGRAGGPSLHVDKPSRAFRETVHALGLLEMFGIAEEAA